MISVSCAVEGDLDEAVARRLLRHAQLQAGTVYGRMGKSHLRLSINGYAAAARHSPWFVLVDLDNDEPCAGSLVSKWLPDRPVKMALRVAVHEAEAWLLADRVNIARFLSVSRDRVPRGVDGVADPKAALIQIAKRSRVRALREGLPPRAGGGRSIGPLYVTEISRFVKDHWDVDAAAAASDSLARCLVALRALH